MSLLSRLSVRLFRGQRKFPLPQLKRYGARQLSLSYPLYNTETSGTKANNDKEEEIDLGPVEFSSSKARTATPMDLYMMKEPPPWYQGLLVSFSLFCFLVYVAKFREPNDFDKRMEEILTVSFPVAEEERLRMEIAVAEMNREDTTVLREQLAAVQQIAAEANQEMEARWKDIEKKAITK